MTQCLFTRIFKGQYWGAPQHLSDPTPHYTEKKTQAQREADTCTMSPHISGRVKLTFSTLDSCATTCFLPMSPLKSTSSKIVLTKIKLILGGFY